MGYLLEGIMTLEIRPLLGAIYAVKRMSEILIPVTYIEYRLILYLYQNDRVVSRDEIIKNVLNQEVSYRTVDVHVKRTNDLFGLKVIESIHGEGYRLRMRYFSMSIPGYKKEEN